MSCENTSATYKEGDVVWVKLGSTWWPCEVRDSKNLPPEVEFKKPPLAVVKFFEEDTYEYIRSWNNICPYSCDKKVEFIKKGMAAFRSNVPHMQKFPKDVSNAEILIGGNPNILSDPMFIPEKKKINDESYSKSKKSSKSQPNVLQSKSHITHRRFLGYNDYKVYICIQSPEKNRIPGDKEDDEVILLNTEPEKKYNCYYCCFTTKRLEVMVIHKKNHFLNKNVKSTKKRPAANKTKKEKIKKAKYSLNKDTSENKEKRTSSNKKKKHKSIETNKSSEETKVEARPKNASDIRSDLLAEWDDDDDEMDNMLKSQFTENPEAADQTKSISEVTNMTGILEVVNTTEISKVANTAEMSEINEDTNIEQEMDEKTSEISSNYEDNSMLTEKEESSISVITPEESNIICEDISEYIDKNKKMDHATEQAIKSCFDFDEEEEEEGSVIIPTTLTGRKIPRVIPLTEKRKSIDASTESNSSMTEGTEYSNKDELDTAFTELMETTNVPELPDLHRTLKCEQNFHKSKTIKFPDKQMEKSLILTNIDSSEKIDPSEVATKLTNPKKRFVKSFEDFELKQSVCKKIEEWNQNKNTVEENADKIEKISEKFEETNSATTEFLKLKTPLISKKTQEPNIDEVHQDEINVQPQNSERSSTDQLNKKEKGDNKRNASGLIAIDDRPSTSNKQAPRGEILETYLSENTKENPESKISKEINCDTSLNKMKHTFPKKKLYGRISHPKKDKTLFSFFLNTNAVQKNATESTDQMDFSDRKFQSPQKNESSESLKINKSENDGEKFMGESGKVIGSNFNDSLEMKKFENYDENFMMEPEKDISSNESKETVEMTKCENNENFMMESEKDIGSNKSNETLELTKCENMNENFMMEPVKHIASNKSNESLEIKKCENNGEYFMMESEEDSVSYESKESFELTKCQNSGDSFMTDSGKDIARNILNETLEVTKCQNNGQNSIMESRKDLASMNFKKPSEITEFENKDETYENKSENFMMESGKDIPSQIFNERLETTECANNDEEFMMETGKDTVYNKSNESLKTNELEENDQNLIMESGKDIASEADLNDKIISTTISRSIEPITETSCDLSSQRITATEMSEKSTNYELEVTEDFSVHERMIQEGIGDIEKIIPCSRSTYINTVSPIPTNIDTDNKDQLVIGKNDDESGSNNENILDTEKYLMTQTIETTCSLETLFVSEKEHPVLEKASMCLPDDAICSPPRKRKQLEPGIILQVSDQSEPIRKKIRKEWNCDISNDNKPTPTANCGILEEVGECIGEMITKVCESHCDNLKNMKPNYEMITETNDIKMTDGGGNLHGTISNENIWEKNINENVLIEMVVDTSQSVNDKEETEVIVQNENENLLATSDLSEGCQKEEFEQCHVSDFTNEEIVEEVIYSTEHDALVEELIENQDEPLTDVRSLSRDVNNGLNNENESDNIVDVEHIKIQNSKCENLNEATIHKSNLIQETTEAKSDHTKLSVNTQITKEEYCSEENIFFETEERHSTEKYSPKNIDDSDPSTQKKNLIQGNLLHFSDSQVSSVTVKTESHMNTACDNISDVKEMSSALSIKEQQYSDHLVNIDGNLTVVSEMDLAEGQVEITPQQIINPTKIIHASHFSTDLSISKSDNSSATNILCETSKGLDSKANVSEKGHVSNEIGVAFGRRELLDILEDETDVDRKIKSMPKKSFIEDFCDFEDHIPSQIVCATRLKKEKDDTKDIKDKGAKAKKNYKIASTASKLLERLTETKKDIKNVKSDISESASESMSLKVTKGKPSSSKTIILSEQIIKSASDQQMPNFKKTLNDIEDLETFIIHKDSKKPNSDKDVVEALSVVEKKTTKSSKNTGKAKILQQTIITASGEIIQPAVTLAQSDENIFDINSMPIVLSDSILTPENIEKMTVVLSSDQSTTSTATNQTSSVVMAGKRAADNKILAKLPSAPSVSQPSSSSLNIISKSSRVPRILQTSSSRIIHRGATLNSSKPGKFILVPQSSTLPTTKGAVKKMVLKRQPVVQSKQPCNTSEVSGNKIMILTNPQGQQQRLLLTPAQQKILGCQPHNSKVSKTIIKGNIVQGNVMAPKTTVATSTIESKVGSESKFTSSTEQSGLLINSPIVADKKITNVTQVVKTGRHLQSNYRGSQHVGKIQQTLLLKKQAVKRIKETNEDLEKQVAEQLEAIKASSGTKVESRVKTPETIKTISKYVTNQTSCTKRNESKFKILPTSVKVSKSEGTKSPTLTSLNSQHPGLKEPIKTKESKVSLERPLNQLVVQDAVGNQTTIVEGQILALPSETINGQPQSYILVTLDQTGTLTPLNNEALMSLDPNLELGGDIGNTVLQIEQGTLTSAVTTRPVASPESVIKKSKKDIANMIQNNSQAQLDIGNATKLLSNNNSNEHLITKPKVSDVLLSNQHVEQLVVSNANTGAGQQLIISGDPLATQKFLESLTEGTTDLANLLASADSSGILIHTDGQQILINTESNNQVLLSVNNENVCINENNEGSGNPIFATQLNKSQDILAAALADTDVFQQDQNLSQSKFSSQLSPNNSLYPINVGNVLETSLTLSSPIMTPLEVPSTNNKKIPDAEVDILTHVPKNVDLPITITDPNISQTVANQQVASFITTELQTNLELHLPMSETAITSVTKDLHSPSFSYALSALEDSEDISQKSFNSNMPLLSEDAEGSADMNKVDSNEIHHKRSSSQTNKVIKKTFEAKKIESVEKPSFLEEDEEEEKTRFTLGREMCSSLSEPPPEMFDLVEVNSSFVKTILPTSLQSTPDSVERCKDDELTDISLQADNSSDGSCEIPVQPKIIAKSQNLDLLNSD